MSTGLKRGSPWIFTGCDRTKITSSPTGNGAAVNGWEVKATYLEKGTKTMPDTNGAEPHVYGVMLKNFAGFEYRIKYHRSVAGVAMHPCVEDLPELSTTPLVCGGGADQYLSESAPIIDPATGAPIGWTGRIKDRPPPEVYTVSFHLVPSV